MINENDKIVVAQQFAEAMPADHENIADFYNKTGIEDYQTAMSTFNFTDPKMIIKKVLSSKADGGLEVPLDAEILDVGCGPGTLGVELKPKGYINLDGVDATETFVEFAKNAQNYRNVEVVWLGCDKMPSDYESKYDIVLGSGVFLKGHFTKNAFDDLHRALKVGGLLVFGIRELYWQPNQDLGYRDKIQELEDEGKFEILSKDQFDRGIEGETDPLFRSQQSYLITIKKLS